MFSEMNRGRGDRNRTASREVREHRLDDYIQIHAEDNVFDKHDRYEPNERSGELHVYAS